MEALGLDFKIMFFQAVNFLVLMIVLGKLLYKPILALLESRQKSISKASEEAERIKLELVKIKSEQKKIMDEAHRQSRLIFEKESQKAKEHHQEMTRKTEAEVSEMLSVGLGKLAAQKETFFKGSRKEIADLVGLLVEKSLREYLTDSEKEKIVEDSLKKIS